MYKPQFSDNISLKMGSDAEKRFDKIARLARYSVRDASQLDQRSHIDRIISGKMGTFSIEVKSMKKISRSDSAPQDKFIWIELHGVHEFDKGWLYGGKADLIAFEMRDGFMFVKRKELIKLVEKVVNFNVITQSPHDAVGKVYLRRKSSDFFGGGFDKVTLIDRKKIENISYFSWSI